MKTLVRAVVVTVFLLVSETALGYITFGMPDCGEWLNQPTASKKAWLLGFLSGQNAMWVRWSRTSTPETVSDGLDKLNSAQQAFAWMDNYCRANPLKTVDDGGQSLFNELLRK